MAGKVDPVDVEFFDREIKPLIDGEFIQFLGEADHKMKNNLMGRAIATLFPITWREPFGLVTILQGRRYANESMAAGTPVIAMGLGAVPEVVAHGRSGFICHSVAECIAAVSQIRSLSRSACREYVEHNFGVDSMTSGYEAVYRQVLAEKFSRNGHLKIATAA
jgi:glycosyltransferase involved in cell wall biosynthesis